MKAKIKPVNDMAVSDEHLSIIILKKPKRRYRQIIKAYYRRAQKKGVSRKGAEGDDPEKKDEKADEDIQKGN